MCFVDAHIVKLCIYLCARYALGAHLYSECRPITYFLTSVRVSSQIKVTLLLVVALRSLLHSIISVISPFHIVRVFDLAHYVGTY